MYSIYRGSTILPPQNLQIANLKNDYDLRKILDFFIRLAGGGPPVGRAVRDTWRWKLQAEVITIYP